MKSRKSYTKPVSELAGYRTFVAPSSAEDSPAHGRDYLRGRSPEDAPASPVLPIRSEDDTESHETKMGPTYENEPGPLPGRKLWRTFGLPGEEYGSPWKEFNQRRTITSSMELEEDPMDKKKILEKIVSEIKNMSPEEMYEEALRLKGEQGEDWDSEEEELLEELRSIVYDELGELEDSEEDEDWGSDTEEDWSEDIPDDETFEGETDLLAYKKRNKRQKSHSKPIRNKRRRALGAMGRMKAKVYGKRYRKTNRTQLRTTRNIRKKQNRRRLGPTVKNRRRAFEKLSHFEQVRISRHGDSPPVEEITDSDLTRLERHGYE